MFAGRIQPEDPKRRCGKHGPKVLVNPFSLVQGLESQPNLLDISLLVTCRD